MSKEFFESKWERLKNDMDELIPEHMHGAVERYLKDGIEPGDFLLAVLLEEIIINEIAKSFIEMVKGKK